jgi:hypothetical protein
LPPIAIIGISALPAGSFYQCYTKLLRCVRRFLAHRVISLRRGDSIFLEPVGWVEPTGPVRSGRPDDSP